MRNRQQEESADRFEAAEWPDAQLELDDEAFARAIAEGREDHVAA